MDDTWTTENGQVWSKWSKILATVALKEERKVIVCIYILFSGWKKSSLCLQAGAKINGPKNYSHGKDNTITLAGSRTTSPDIAPS